MHKIYEAALWMFNELKATGYLSQLEAVNHIADEFGEELTYRNDRDNLAISRGVLNEFKKLHMGKAVWQKGSFSWHWEE